MQISRDNHYVPKWYQKGFLLGTRGTLHRLDLNPPTRQLPDGRTIVGKALELRSPKRCFQVQDLYTTRFGRTLNDEVERFLFGAIDSVGALAVRAFAGGDARAIHDRFQGFFEYLDAQKLRTPKGLDWIKSKYPSLTQVDLMVEMQRLRQMHCTMWVECVREIVSAEKSDVKFIVTDHPVTAYNAACGPGSPACLYPDDPPIALTGTQTVFALDADHCLILTNLEYARDPTGVDLLTPRQNPRYSGETLARTNAMIRTRALSRDEVVSINSLLKARSHRYVAAYEEACLFPERAAPVAWKDIASVLLPPSDGLWDFGGETFVGYDDGSTRYQDAFGRTDPAHEFLKKKTPPTAPGPSDPCPCGSGKRYGKCCRSVPEDDRPPWRVHGVRDRNLMLCNAVVGILGFDRGKTWEDVRRELSDAQVKKIHEVVAMLWPPDTNLAELLPRPDGRVFRAVFMGFVDPRTITESVISSLAYFDEILIPNPFPNPRYMSPEYSPTQSPGKHKSQLLKNVSVLFDLHPFIDAGIVHLVPDPMEFNADIRREMRAMSEERAANWSLKPEETRLAQTLGRDDLARATSRLPVDQLSRLIRRSQPGIAPELLESTIASMKETLAQDPLALLQPLSDGADGGDLQGVRSITLEMALFVAHLTGAAIYTDQAMHWRQLHEHTRAAAEDQRSRWEPLARKMASLAWPIELNESINLEMRQAGRLGRMRRFFRHLRNAALEPTEGGDRGMARELATRVENASLRSAPQWDRCSASAGPSMRLQRRIEMSAPRAGFDLNSVHRLLVTSGRTNYLASVPIAFLLSTDGGVDDAPPK